MTPTVEQLRKEIKFPYTSIVYGAVPVFMERAAEKFTKLKGPRAAEALFRGVFVAINYGASTYEGQVCFIMQPNEMNGEDEHWLADLVRRTGVRVVRNLPSHYKPGQTECILLLPPKAAA